MAINYLFMFPDYNLILQEEDETSIVSLLSKQQASDHHLSSYYFVQNGHPVNDIFTNLHLSDEEKLSKLVILQGRPRLVGGKGGFGALIRAMGMHINKGRSKDASRDLNGRRIRDVNAEKQLAEWSKKEPERKRKKDEEKLKKRQELLNGPRHFFNDPNYMQLLEENEANVEDSVKLGLQKASSSSNGRQKASSKRSKSLWIGLNEEELDDSESDDDDVCNTETPKAKKFKSNEEPVDIPVIPPVTLQEETPTQHVVTSSSSQGQDEPSYEQQAPSQTSSNELDTSHKDNATRSLPPKYQDGSEALQDQSASLKEDSLQQSHSTSNNISITPDPTLINRFNLDDYNSSQELENVGGDVLKAVLQAKGLKCGGTLQERAQRLMSVKGKDISEIDPTLFAKGGPKSKGKRKNKQ